MSTKIPALKFFNKAVAATVIGAAAAVATGGAAFATTTTVGSTPAVSGHLSCARAPKALAKITKVEGAINKRLPKLEGAETTLKAKGHTKAAVAVAKRISAFKKADSKAAALAKRIEARCPSGTSS
jgi:amino acid transporter